jgi:hypothetical protein
MCNFPVLKLKKLTKKKTIEILKKLIRLMAKCGADVGH